VGRANERRTSCIGAGATIPFDYPKGPFSFGLAIFGTLDRLVD